MLWGRVRILGFSQKNRFKVMLHPYREMICSSNQPPAISNQVPAYRQLSTVTALRAVILSWGVSKNTSPKATLSQSFPFHSFTLKQAWRSATSDQLTASCQLSTAVNSLSLVDSDWVGFTTKS